MGGHSSSPSMATFISVRPSLKGAQEFLNVAIICEFSEKAVGIPGWVRERDTSC